MRWKKKIGFPDEISFLYSGALQFSNGYSWHRTLIYECQVYALAYWVKIGFDIWCKLSEWNVKAYFLEKKNKKNVVKWSPAELAQRVVKANFKMIKGPISHFKKRFTGKILVKQEKLAIPVNLSTKTIMESY